MASSQQVEISETAKLSDRFADDVKSLAEWQANRPRYLQEFSYMLGLSPLPEKTPLQATITGTLEGAGYVVDLLHYQSLPGLYVTATLYPPYSSAPTAKTTEHLPAMR